MNNRLNRANTVSREIHSIYWAFECYQGGKINNVRWQAIFYQWSSSVIHT